MQSMKLQLTLEENGLVYKGNQKQFKVNAELDCILDQIQIENEKESNSLASLS